MTIEREYDKEMGADRGPLLNELERIERVHKMTTRDESGVPVMPWFAGVKSGTYVRFVPKAIVAAKPWCSSCGKPLAIENGPAWNELIFRCYTKGCDPFRPIPVPNVFGPAVERLREETRFNAMVDRIQRDIERTIPATLEQTNEMLKDMTWLELPPSPRAPWWKRAWARIKECF